MNLAPFNLFETFTVFTLLIVSKNYCMAKLSALRPIRCIEYRAAALAIFLRLDCAL